MLSWQGEVRGGGEGMGGGGGRFDIPCNWGISLSTRLSVLAGGACDKRATEESWSIDWLRDLSLNINKMRNLSFNKNKNTSEVTNKSNQIIYWNFTSDYRT